MALFPGLSGWAGARRKSSSGLYGTRGDIRGKHTNNPALRHFIQTNQWPTSLIPPFLCRKPFVPQPSQFILAWDRHQICWLAYPVLNKYFSCVWLLMINLLHLIWTTASSLVESRLPPHNIEFCVISFLFWSQEGGLDHPNGNLWIIISVGFYGPKALSVVKTRVSKHWRKKWLQSANPKIQYSEGLQFSRTTNPNPKPNPTNHRP